VLRRTQVVCYVRPTYLLTPWSRVLLKKLTGSAASQEIPRIFGTRRFITVPTSARHLSLSWANYIQSSQPPPTSWRSILILSSHLRLGLPSGLFPSDFPTRTLCTPSLPPYVPHAPPISFFSILPPAQYYVRPTRMVNNYRRFEEIWWLDFQGSGILGLSDPKKLPHIRIHLPNDTETHPTELNQNVRVRSDLYCIGETTVENYYTVMSSKQIHRFIGHYINYNGYVSTVVFSKRIGKHNVSHEN